MGGNDEVVCVDPGRSAERVENGAVFRLKAHALSPSLDFHLVLSSPEAAKAGRVTVYG